MNVVMYTKRVKLDSRLAKHLSIKDVNLGYEIFLLKLNNFMIFVKMNMK